MDLAALFRRPMPSAHNICVNKAFEINPPNLAAHCQVQKKVPFGIQKRQPVVLQKAVSKKSLPVTWEPEMFVGNVLGQRAK